MNNIDELTRRELIGITAGFALAASPITSWAVTTPTEGLIAGAVKIPTSKGEMPGYWAMPAKGEGPFSIVLVIQEIFGIHAYIQDVCRRLAKEGYLAIAPSLYFRQGDATQITDIQEILSKIVSKVPQAQVMEDLDETLKWLEKNKKANSSKIAMTGFCWGGNVTWMYAAHNPKIKAGVAWYGRVAGDEKQKPSPIDIAKDLKVPVLGLYGGKDTHIPVESVEKMRSKLREGKSGSEIVIYPDADHGFHADYRPSYHEKSAQDGWSRLLKWLKSHEM